MNPPVVVCFGQRAAGDDAVALWVRDQLVAEGVPARAAADASLLLDLLGQDLRVIVVDAVVATFPMQARVLHLHRGALAKAGVSPVSSHGLGIVEALDMAETLYGTPAERIDIVAIPIARVSGELDRLSAAARAAIAPACALVHALYSRRSGVQARAQLP